MRNEGLRNAAKIIVIFDTQKHASKPPREGVGGTGVTPIKHSLAGVQDSGPAARAGLAANPPCPPSSCYLGCFLLGFEDPVLSSLTDSGQKWGPNCADDVPVRGARARAS